MPSRNALRALRHLALAGSNGIDLCSTATLTYDTAHRVRLAEQNIGNKRNLKTSAPKYDATSSAQRLSVIMKAPDTTEFAGLDSAEQNSSLEAKNEPEARSVPKRQLHSPLGMRPNKESESLEDSVEDNGSDQSEDTLADALDQELKEASTDALFDLEEEIRALVKQDQEVKATGMFLQRFHMRRRDDVLHPVKQLARALFAVNCTKGNVFVARALFERIQAVSEDQDLWVMMMHLLAKKGHVESVGALYEKYQTRYTVPSHLLEVVLRCLLESRRLTIAKRLFYARIEDDREGGLCGVYLDGLWRKTRSQELVAAEFRAILARLATIDRRPTEKIFNPLIKAYIEAGSFEDAETVVSDMSRRFGLQPGCRSLGLVAYCRALLCDWDGVMTTLREIHLLGFSKDKTTFAHAFDRVFLEYYPTHSGPEIYKFLTTCIKDFNIVPDKLLHQHIIEALIERGDSDMVGDITRMAEDNQWNSGLDQAELLRILDGRQLNARHTPVGVWRMMQAAKAHYGKVATSRRLMGVGAESYRTRADRANVQPIHRMAEKTYTEAVKDLVSKQSINFYVPLMKRMEQQIHAGNFDHALKSFRFAERNGFAFVPVHIKLAAIAAILEHGKAGVAEARLIIKAHCPYWTKSQGMELTPNFPRYAPIFFQQILQFGGPGPFPAPVLKLALFEFYQLCEDTPTFTVKNHAVVSLARGLIAQDHAPSAVKLLRAVYLSKWRKTHGFDHVQLKMLLRAYAVLGDAKGVWWCLMTVLARPEPVNIDFANEVELQLPQLERTLGQPNPDGSPSSSLSILKRIINAMWRKYYGDAPFANARFDPERKKESRARVLTRSKEDQAALPEMSVEEMIKSFDEEMEMDFLVGRRHFDRAAILKWWNEPWVVRQSRVLPEYVEYPAAPGFDPTREVWQD